MPDITGIKALQAKLKAMEKIGRQASQASVTVGYTQSYGIYVHENLDAHHPVGQAKFLEQPARAIKKELGTIIGDIMAQGKTMEQALLVAGLRLQREAQKLTPVDTGALKASAFTSLTKNEDKAAEAAYKKSQAIRNSAATRKAKSVAKKKARKAKLKARRNKKK